MPLSDSTQRVHPPSVVARFWPKVKIHGPDDCWEWTASRTGKNAVKYGQFVVSHQRPVVAHRVSWEIHHGPIPDGLFVLHRCDNPPCVNPGHLFLGTHQANMDDMAAKGRDRRVGRAPGFGKFTPEMKAKAVRMREAGHTQTTIAREVGVSQPIVSRFFTGARP